MIFGLSDAKNGSKWSGAVRLQPNARHIETAVTFWGQLPKSIIQSYHTRTAVDLDVNAS